MTALETLPWVMLLIYCLGVPVIWVGALLSARFWTLCVCWTLAGLVVAPLCLAGVVWQVFKITGGWGP